MGAAEFWINIELSKNDFGVVDSIFNENRLFKNYIPHSFNEEKNSMNIICAKVCFFPITNIIYDLLEQINQKNPIVCVSSRGNSRTFDFEDELDFFCWLYRTWKDSLEYFNEYWGTFLTPTDPYYGNKLSYLFLKKYFVKYRKNKQCE